MGCGASHPKGAKSLNGQNGDSSIKSITNGGRQGLKRTDSGRSTASSKRRGGGKAVVNTTISSSHHSLTNGHALNGEDKVGSVSPTADHRWIHLWETHKELLLDPADVHSTMEACMARVTNKLSVTEITFLQRKVRSIVRASCQLSQDQKQSRVTNILRSSPNSSQEQETKLVAEKYHLLSNHVIRKVLPKLPVTSLQETPMSSYSLIADNVFLLGLFLHESLWDRVAQTAADSAQAAGAIIDVNHFKLPEEAPLQVPATSTDFPEVPPGMSLHALTFLMALALRGTRTQKVQLLFYLLLPPKLLQEFLEGHPAGGPPLWLLEVGPEETLLSMASLSHYFYYGDSFTPAGVPFKPTAISSAHVETAPSSRLSLNASTLVSVIKSILLPPNPQGSDGAKTPNGALQSDVPSNGSKSPLTSPKKTTKMRRRASNQSSEDEIIIQSPQTEVMERLGDANAFSLDDYLDDSDDLGLRETLTQAATALEGKESVTMPDFYDFCQRTLNDQALDAVMFRFFGHSILPTPSLELELVTNRWREWQETECVLYNKAIDEPEGTFEMLTQSVRKILLMQKEETIEVSAERATASKPFGGLGGFDGRGGMGFGVMCCVDKKWWDEWEDYVGWSWAGENSVVGTGRLNRTRRRPRSVSSEPLLDRFDDDVVAGTHGSYELMKQDLRKDFDYVLVPASVWDILYELYGGGPPLPRMVLPPPSTSKGEEMNPMSCGSAVSTVDSGLRAAPSETQLDAMASTDNGDRVLRIPQHMVVNTHPWVLHFHLCDPLQPYRRGDAGPLSIRVMAAPDQPLWRLFAEIVVRLPFHLYRSYGSDGRGKARLWKRSDPSSPKDAMTRFGPWTLLCKNRVASLPKRGDDDELEQRFEELKEDWKTFADNASVESIGILDGDQLMVECAIVNRNGEFWWPREAAAKAGRVKRLADQDMKFRQLLKGVDDAGKPLAAPEDLVGMKVDAMDTSGKWFQVEIIRVQLVAADTDEEDESAEMENEELRRGDGESKQVLVDFSEHGGHSEWIDVESDRLASPGRFTIGSVEEEAETTQKPANGTTGNTGDKSKQQTQVKKVDETTGKLCTIPGYGACGLANLGNTCYANSAIQCVSYLPMLRSYLLSLQYKATGDLNKDNPLGTEGKLLEELAELLRQMWSGKMGEKSPTKFRQALGKANELFQGADQQDSQEFLSFILDVLHEDSNRVRRKPAVEGLEDDWKKKNTLPRVGEEEWRRFLRRNRSIMADVGMGQVLNTVTCPVCNFSSRNFDPFNLLSLPIPSIADVIFKCFVVRRASAYNAPWVLNKPKSKGGKARVRFVRRDLVPNPKPPSGQFIVEEYIIAMSRLADSGDLKLQIQNLAGIPASALSVCRGEIVASKERKDESVLRTHFQATLLTDKEGPCSQLANRQRANSEDLAAAPSSPSLIVAFESTIRSRPVEDKKDEDSSDSNNEEEEEEKAEADKSWEPSKKEMKELEKHVEQYGNIEECRLYDTETLLIAKALSRSLWPRTEDDLKLGLRVDAIDHKEHWFPGSVVEIIETEAGTNGGDLKDEGAKIKVRIHFDNFSSKWDEMYTIRQFQEGRVRPLYSHAAPRLKPTEFIVHHRFTDRTSRVSSLFGQSFYVQCHNEWTTARAGAQILAQASRFLKLPAQYNGSKTTDEAEQEREAKIQRLYDRTQAVISDLIDALIDCDKEYVQYALGVATDPDAAPGNEVQPYRNPGFDASAVSQKLIDKVGALLHRLPFEVRVCTIDSTLGGTNEELAYPFSLMRTIGNYMNARHAIVLQWREPPSDKKAVNGRHSSYLGAPVMYVPPRVVIDADSAEILNKANQKAKKTAASRGSGGLPLGICLTEYCKLQQLPTWRCPKCKDFRDGKQNMALWRLPDLLTIHMKRFNCSARWREKITTKVNFPLTGLDLQEWCHEESPVLREDGNGETCIYDLVGVLNHYGGMTGGHYVATCKASACSRDGSEEVAYDFNGVGSFKPFFTDSDVDPETQSGWKFGRQKSEVNQKKLTANTTARAAAESAEPLWLQFDDDLVDPIPPRQVVSETAYVLFYRRRRITPSNIAKYSTLE